ncbi:ATP-binding cassette domain-containing protein [Paenibacillus thermoaerophilus]|nr:ATP-binding cassette domain-containing protein [Paenibacillus thermoaerophilus]
MKRENRIGVVGVNGAGKSTLMAALAGEIEADEGRFLERLSTHTLSVGDGQTRFSLKPYSENRL